MRIRLKKKESIDFFIKRFKKRSIKFKNIEKLKIKNKGYRNKSFIKRLKYKNKIKKIQKEIRIKNFFQKLH
ncbi:30S ribosomal subunit protein S21 [Candidatus Nasuia deltocephalinicola str. NAS-ALF]|uniref:30S ribosomal subunit protein S21 n=1 Tax=Candidatus Nasuia deltocephalinicola str. NAS-ALF TaxID=1343077 RepID=S5SYE2_9PROT|nr:30S ribosomal subunit protein S21 [Candidatus Nasuia deltocephalinicola str. NAS-ALF]